MTRIPRAQISGLRDELRTCANEGILTITGETPDTIILQPGPAVRAFQQHGVEAATGALYRMMQARKVQP